MAAFFSVINSFGYDLSYYGLLDFYPVRNYLEVAQKSISLKQVRLLSSFLGWD